MMYGEVRLPRIVFTAMDESLRHEYRGYTSNVRGVLESDHLQVSRSRSIDSQVSRSIIIDVIVQRPQS